MIDPVQLAADLISCPSVTPEEGGALNLLEGILKQAGFKTHRLKFDGDGSYPVDNLYARFGSGEPNFCFAGHTDVVPPGDLSKWTSPPFEPVIRERYLFGRGAEDMKAAIAAMVSASLQYINDNKGFGGSISFLITGDEEASAINGTKKVLGWMKEKGEVISASLVGEPTNPSKLGEMVKIGRRGSVSAKITCHGVQGHVAYPHLADNPVSKIVKILHELKTEKLDEGTEFFQPSNLEITTVDVGNPADNVIPGVAEAVINIRFNDRHTISSLQKWIKEVVAKHDAKAEITFRVTGEAFITQKGKLSETVCKSVHEITGVMPELSTTGGTSDARFIKDFCPVVEFGTTGRTAHKVDENVAVEDVEVLKKVYLRILEKFFA